MLSILKKLYAIRTNSNWVVVNNDKPLSVIMFSKYLSLENLMEDENLCKQKLETLKDDYREYDFEVVEFELLTCSDNLQSFKTR